MLHEKCCYMKIIGSPSNIQTANKTVFIVKTKLMSFFFICKIPVYCSLFERIDLPGN